MSDRANPGDELDGHLKTIRGFYPTPPTVIRLMIEKLGKIEMADRVLEPSAGSGNIADQLSPLCNCLVLVEPDPHLADVLRNKGYSPLERRFEDYSTNEQFQKVIMNPPFAQGLDMLHVRRALEMLSPGGTLVALMNDGESEVDGSPAQNRDFNEWLFTSKTINSFEINRLDQALFLGAENFRPSATPIKMVKLCKARVG